MKKLKSTVILGKKVKIKYKNMEDWGLCLPDDNLIILSTKCLEDNTQHFNTLLHEVTHFILSLTGLSYMEKNEEEAYVRCIENLIMPWHEANRHLKEQK